MQAFLKLNAVDVLALVALALGTLRGGRRGLSAEIGRLFNVVAAVALALFGFNRAAGWLCDTTTLRLETARAVAFPVLGVASYLIILVILVAAGRVVRLTFVPGIERSLGAVAGFLWTAAVIAFLVLTVSMWPGRAIQRHLREGSAIGRAIATGVPQMRTPFRDLPLNPDAGPDQDAPPSAKPAGAG
jgi:uncharacterized membrane protein required for colicin V production